MKLIDQVLGLCQKLSDVGWDDVFETHGLDICKQTAGALAKELARPLKTIDRTAPGFEGFAANGVRGIEPGSPARSLLYHALASPEVLNAGDEGPQVSAFPTLEELEWVENYVFGVRPPTLAELVKRAAGKELSVVVFAYEYRPASQTCHGLHADMVYSRTGVARVGTAEALYHPDLRGFLPEVENDPSAIRVLPARYAAYLSARRPGNPNDFIPMRYRGPAAAKKNDQVPKPDDMRQFWVPIHKLFSGSECLAKEDLVVKFGSRHFNQKIFRVHQTIDEPLPNAEYPYQFSEGIAELSKQERDGTGLLVPVTHSRLVAPARTREGGWATFPVTSARIVREYSSYSPKEPTEGRPPHRSAPQYVNAKVEVLQDGTLVDLNDDSGYETLHERATAGDYRALHFVDFTGDGWVGVECAQLANRREIACPPRPAYSLVTAPDFFPLCSQRELSEWTESSAVSPKLRESIWWVAPDALSDQRFAANLQLPLSPFDPAEDSVTGLVPLWGTQPPKGQTPPRSSTRRHAHLPDDAAGVFDPGWDVSLDTLGHGKTAVEHLAAYGLGSPFPEDAKLCAALGTFWPSVSPDTTRVMEPLIDAGVHTVSPLTDAEIGQVGGLPWDGVAGPRVIEIDGQAYAEFADSHHVDYVRGAMRGEFTMRLIGQIDGKEYENRVLAMSLVHRAIMANPKRRSDWIVLSFRVVRPSPESLFDDGRHAPEYLHIRTELLTDGTTRDLNLLSDTDTQDDLTPKLAAAYRAQHYVDHTGDGWVDVVVDCPYLFAAGVPALARPAYALVTAPDFFPSCDQRELSEWTSDDLPLPQGWRKQIWYRAPLCLCDQRLAPNVQTTNANGQNPLDRDEQTITALIPLFGSFSTGTKPGTAPALRHSHLPDDAAGTFAPGWDVSQDSFQGPDGGAVWHLAAYGLGSPFPEDSKLCAALSTFWPSVAPDITRVMEPNPGRNSGTVSPLTDEEIGQVGNLPWDGVPGPIVVKDGMRQFVDYANFRHVDYVRIALERKFTMRLLARIDAREYKQRTLAAALGFIFLGGRQPDPSPPEGFLTEVRLKWRMLSFRKVNPGDPDLEGARSRQSGSLLAGDVYRMECFTARSKPQVDESNFFRVKIEVDQRRALYVAPSTLEVIPA